MSALAQPQRRPNPLNGFAPYEGEFNLLSFDYVAVCASARAAHAPTAPDVRRRLLQATAWCGLFGIVLAASVIVLTVTYGLIKAALWLLNRHAIRIVSATRQRACLQCGRAILRNPPTDAPPGLRKRFRQVRLTALPLARCARFCQCACRALTTCASLGRSVFGDRLRLLLRVVGSGLFIVCGIFGGAAALWIGGALVRSAVLSATRAGLSWVNGAVGQTSDVLHALAAVGAELPASAVLVAPVSAAHAALSTLAAAASSGSDAVFAYADQAALATNLIGAFFVLVGLLCTATVALSSRRGAVAMAVLLWVLMIVTWVICGITYVATVASADACAALDQLLQPAQAARLQRLVRCADDGGAAASTAWGVIRESADTVNSALYSFSVSGTGSGAANLAGITFKCNPAVATAAGGFAAATAPCPPLAASIDALHNASRTFPHTVAASASFAAAYAAFRCPVSDSVGCAAAGLVPADQLAAISALDGNVSALVAVMPELEKLTRCADVARMLRGLQLGQCGDLRAATQLVFAGFLTASVGFVGAFFLFLFGAQRFLPEESLLAGAAWVPSLQCKCCEPPPPPRHEDPDEQLAADKGRAVDALRVAGAELSRVAQIAVEIADDNDNGGGGKAQNGTRRGGPTRRLGPS